MLGVFNTCRLIEQLLPSCFLKLLDPANSSDGLALISLLFQAEVLFRLGLEVIPFLSLHKPFTAAAPVS